MIEDVIEQQTEDFADQHRRLGEAVTSILTEYSASLDSRKVTSTATPADLEKLFDESFPETGTSMEQLLARFVDEVLPHAMQVASPRYFGQFNPTPLPIGVWADVLASALTERGRVAQWANVSNDRSARPALVVRINRLRL